MAPSTTSGSRLWVSGTTAHTAQWSSSYQVWIRSVYMCVLDLFLCTNEFSRAGLSAPCQPTDIKVDVDCGCEGGAVVSWNSTYGTANFSLSAYVNGSHQTLCTTQQNSCNVTGLSCGQTYNISVTASDQLCVAAAVNSSLTTREPSHGLCPA